MVLTVTSLSVRSATYPWMTSTNSSESRSSSTNTRFWDKSGNGQSAMFIYIYPVFEYPSFSSLSNNLVIDIGQGGKRGRELLPAGFRLTWRWMLVEVVWYNIDNCIWSQHLQYLQYLQYLPLCPGPSKLCQPSCGPRPLWRHSGRTPHQYHINSEAETEDRTH